MEKSEIIKILSYLNNCYGNRFKFPKENDPASTMMVEVWHDFLKYYQYQLVSAAVKKLIINQPKWPPTPGEIAKEVEMIKLPAEAKITAGEAWHLALKAVHSYGYYNSRKGMESLPECVREAVRNFGGFAALCHSEDNNYVKSSFMKIFKEVALKDQENRYLPKPFKEQLLLISKQKEVD